MHKRKNEISKSSLFPLPLPRNVVLNQFLLFTSNDQRDAHKAKKTFVPSYIPKNNRSVGKIFYSYLFFVLSYFFLTGEKKVNSELKCPSINQLKKQKTKQ